MHVSYNRNDWHDGSYANNGHDNGDRSSADDDAYDDNGRYSGSDRTDRADRNGDYRDEDREARIAYRGNDLRYSKNARPFWVRDVLMVPLTKTADQLDLSVDSYQSDDTIIVRAITRTCVSNKGPPDIVSMGDMELCRTKSLCGTE